MSRTSSPWLVTPTLKSPSVARITRLMPPLMNDAGRDVVGELDAGGAVGRAAGFRSAIARWIIVLAMRPASTAARGRSRRRRRRSRRDRAAVSVSASMRIAVSHERQLVGRRPSSPTRRAGTRGCAAAFARLDAAAACRPISASRCRGFHGHGANFRRHRERRIGLRRPRSRSGSS